MHLIITMSYELTGKLLAKYEIIQRKETFKTCCDPSSFIFGNSSGATTKSLTNRKFSMAGISAKVMKRYYVAH